MTLVSGVGVRTKQIEKNFCLFKCCLYMELFVGLWKASRISSLRHSSLLTTKENINTVPFNFFKWWITNASANLSCQQSSVLREGLICIIYSIKSNKQTIHLSIKTSTEISINSEKMYILGMLRKNWKNILIVLCYDSSKSNTKWYQNLTKG